jgi:hypothetical protein
MKLAHLIIVIILKTVHSLHPLIKGHGPYKKCNDAFIFYKAGITVPSNDWTQSIPHMTVRHDDGFATCHDKLLCPQFLKCQYSSKTCTTHHADWMSHIEIQCPRSDACLEHCFVSFRIHSTIILQEFTVWMTSVVAFTLCTWFIFTISSSPLAFT